MAADSAYRPRTVKTVMRDLQKTCSSFDYYEIRISPQWRRIRDGREALNCVLKNFTVNLKVGDGLSSYRKIRQQVHGEKTWGMMMSKIKAYKELINP